MDPQVTSRREGLIHAELEVLNWFLPHQGGCCGGSGEIGLVSCRAAASVGRLPGLGAWEGKHLVNFANLLEKKKTFIFRDIIYWTRYFLEAPLAPAFSWSRTFEPLNVGIFWLLCHEAQTCEVFWTSCLSEVQPGGLFSCSGDSGRVHLLPTIILI